jgi:hypothetical protein
MNKKDFWTLILCNAVAVVLLIQHFCKIPIAFECFCIWTLISMLIHIGILRDYVKVPVFVKEDHTR